MGARRELEELLSEVGLFSRCTKRERQTIARHAQAAELPAGVDLVREGEPGDALFVILEGEAVVTREGHEVGRVGPGSHFGELAILDGAPRSATVRRRDRGEGRRARDPDVPHPAAGVPGAGRGAAGRAGR